jgi:hypothetical protein
MQPISPAPRTKSTTLLNVDFSRLSGSGRSGLQLALRSSKRKTPVFAWSGRGWSIGQGVRLLPSVLSNREWQLILARHVRRRAGANDSRLPSAVKGDWS